MDIITVVGSQRSGTTLMSHIIGSHPLGIMIDENDKLYDWTDACLASASSESIGTLFNQCYQLTKAKYFDLIPVYVLIRMGYCMIQRNF